MGILTRLQFLNILTVSTEQAEPVVDKSPIWIHDARHEAALLKPNSYPAEAVVLHMRVLRRHAGHVHDSAPMLAQPDASLNPITKLNGCDAISVRDQNRPPNASFFSRLDSRRGPAKACASGSIKRTDCRPSTGASISQMIPDQEPGFERVD